ncbi:MAG: alpha-ribazole phosphatase [Bacteroidales bacterium]
MELILIRHTSVAVEKGICYGQTDVNLTENFITEAQVVHQNLRTLIGNETHPVYCSPLSRCRRLAAFCGFTDPVFDDRIMEMNFGAWEMTPFDKIEDPRLQNWYDDWIEAAPTNGESFSDMIVRVSGFIEELKTQSLEKAVLFTHGGVIACTRVYAGQCRPQDAFKSLAQYGEIVRFNF